ncbi:TPA: DUF6392 family protein [Photobacterium damselae]
MINVIELILMIDKTIDEITNTGLLNINQKPKPQFSGDDELVLNMIREGVCLVFDRQTTKLKDINLELIYDEKPNYRFPNELPNPLMPIMTKQYIHQAIGVPYESQPAVSILGTMTGGVDHFKFSKNKFRGLSLLVYYAEDQERVSTLLFTKTELVNW